MSTAPRIARRLGLADAVVLGVASMVGAGVFAVFAPAADAAGSWLLLGLLIAAVVAFCNATSSAQLAARYPGSGGTYLYGRERLGEWWGFAAGWSFVIGKTASCAAMAMTFAAYAVPAPWQRPVAVAAIVTLAVVNSLGVTRTASLARVLVAVSLVALAVVLSTASGGAPGWAGEQGGSIDPYGVLQSAGLLFFAFAGYARIATMGEEVREPGRTIPRAIVIALTFVVLLYAAVALVVLGALGSSALADSTAPLVDTVRSVGWDWAVPVVTVGAAAASLGALLALMAGIGRTAMAMARERDLPRWLGAVHPRFRVPHRAELVLGLAAAALVLLVDLRAALGFSSFAVLTYYFIANLAAIGQPRDERMFPRALQALGLLGCATMALTLPPLGAVLAAAVLLAGVLGRLLFRWLMRR